ncbi:MAG: hypothetical protein AAGJ70_01665 [Pseudomonadota bacterium]
MRMFESDCPGVGNGRLAAARAALACGDTVEAELQIRAAREADPRDAGAALMLGMLLLDLDRVEGLTHLKHAMASHDIVTRTACRVAISWLEARGDHARANGFRQRLRVWEATAVIDAPVQDFKADRTARR